MDKRYQPLAIEIVVGSFIFGFIYYTADLDLASGGIFMIIMLLWLLRLLFKMRSLRKQGVDLNKQMFRNVWVDTFFKGKDAGDTVATLNKWRFYATLVLTLIFFLIFYFKELAK